MLVALGCVYYAGCEPGPNKLGEQTPEPPSPPSPAMSSKSPSDPDRLRPHQPEDPVLAAKRLQLLDHTLRTGVFKINDERVLQAMAAVPREEFCPASERRFAYENHPLPIGEGQTISQPYIVAFMTEALQPKPEDRILEIGTGSGYQAAVLSLLSNHVYTIEIVDSLARGAAERLQRLGYDHVTVKSGDGYAGWPEHAPFDSIIVTCAPDNIPRPLIEQLREGGRMIIPVGAEGGVQNLILLEKHEGKVTQQSVMDVRFVPMTGRAERE